MEELRRRVDEVNWFHTIDLGNGVVTPGWDDSPSRLARMYIPGGPDRDERARRRRLGRVLLLRGRAPRRGARARDRLTSHGRADGWGSKAGFELAHDALGSSVESRTIDVLDLSPETVGVFDLVLFLGVLYHMRDPLLALEQVASVTGKQLILDTHVDLIGPRRPAAALLSRETS